MHSITKYSKIWGEVHLSASTDANLLLLSLFCWFSRIVSFSIAKPVWMQRVLAPCGLCSGFYYASEQVRGILNPLFNPKTGL